MGSPAQPCAHLLPHFLRFLPPHPSREALAPCVFPTRELQGEIWKHELRHFLEFPGVCLDENGGEFHLFIGQDDPSASSASVPLGQTTCG